MIVCDTREPDHLVDLIDGVAEEVRRETLKVGDFLVRDRLVERKEYTDFLGRLGQDENGIFMQMQRTVTAAEEQDLVPVLILEGDAEAALRWGDIGMNELIGAVAGVHKMGVTVIALPDERATARFLASLETSAAEGSPRKIRDTPSVPEELMGRYLAQGFSRVGAKKADRLLERFGSFRAIVNAKPEELEQVEGIGPSTAQKIHRHCRMGLPEDE